MTGAGIVALECLLQAREHPDGMLAGAFADATGTLTADAVRAALASGHPYLRAIGSFSSAVTMRYQALLRDLAEDPAGLHRRFVTAMAGGGLVPLEGWLDARHGPGFFARRFRTPAFDAAAGQSGDGHLAASPRSSGLVRPVTSSPETRSRTAGRAWISSGASRSAASRALMQSARRPQVP